jgi:hypothetical protein
MAAADPVCFCSPKLTASAPSPRAATARKRGDSCSVHIKSVVRSVVWQLDPRSRRAFSGQVPWIKNTTKGTEHQRHHYIHPRPEPMADAS